MSNRLRFVTVALLAASAALAGAAFAGRANGVAGSMPAYYDGNLFKINFMPVPASGTTAVLGHNKSVNNIFMSDTPLSGGGMFVAVLDAIQADGFNPLWEEESITFNAGHAPRQLTSDTDVAAAATSGEITVTSTGELYRCSVIGQKPQPAATGATGAHAAAPAGLAATHSTSWGSLKHVYR